jgi:hypothetical protein
MKTDIRFLNVQSSEAQVSHIGRCVHLATRRFAERIRSVVVRVRDLNGPRGGIDKECSIVVHAPPFGRIFAGARHADAYGAVSEASSRLDGLLGRFFPRVRTRPRRRERR